MSIRYYLIALCVLSVSFKGFAQSKKQVDSIKNIVQKIVREAVDTEKVKDSTAVYGLSIVIDVVFKKNKQTVTIKTNNSLLSPGFNFEALDNLKKVDFLPIIKDRNAYKFSFKVCFIVYDSKYNPQVVKLDSVYETIKNLSLSDEYDVPNLGLILIRFDKKVYE